MRGRISPARRAPSAACGPVQGARSRLASTPGRFSGLRGGGGYAVGAWAGVWGGASVSWWSGGGLAGVLGGWWAWWVVLECLSITSPLLPSPLAPLPSRPLSPSSRHPFSSAVHHRLEDPPPGRKSLGPPGLQTRRERAPPAGPKTAELARCAGEMRSRTLHRAGGRRTGPVCWRGSSAHPSPARKPPSWPGVLVGRCCAPLPTGGCSPPMGPVPGWATVLSAARSLLTRAGAGWVKGGPEAHRRRRRAAPLRRPVEARHWRRSERPGGHLREEVNATYATGQPHPLDIS